MSWEVALLTSATALIADLIVGLAKQSPPYLFAPYLRLWKESALLHDVLHNNRFSNWKPQAARYVALQAIKALGAHQESPQPVLDLLESFLKRHEPVVLLGEPGAGKTTALEALTYRLSRRALLYNRLIWLALLIVTAVFAFAAPIFTFLWLASFILWEPAVRRFTVPLFIEARSDYLGGDVNEWCEKTFKDRLGAKPLIGSRRRVALFLDGVNEVQESLYGGFVEGWRARLRDKPACRVIFTSRGGDENPAKILGVESVLSVCDLDDDGVREFLKVYGREKAVEEKKPYNAEQAKSDFDELQKKNLLGEGSIGRNPYWLKMIVESGLYTVNRGALFRNFAEKLIRRETEEKPEERKHKPDWKVVPIEVEMDALAALALAMHEEKRIGFSDEAGWDKARAAVRKSIGDLPYSPDDILSEAHASTLLRVQFKKRVEFVHQLVQEFFAAYAFHPVSKWQEALAHCEDIWWWQTLFHMGGLVGEKSAQPYSELVRKMLGDGSNEQRVFAAIGLLRSVENPPSELSSAVIEAFGGLMEKNLTLREGKTTLNLTEAQQRALPELTRTLGEETAEAFTLLLEDARIEIQIIGILILGIVGSRHAAELIIRTLNDLIYGFVGITPLVRIGAPAIEPLIAALQDEDRFVRMRGADALGQIGDAQAVEPLIAALRDEYPGVRGSAGDALVRIGALSVERIIAALRDEDIDVRWRAAEALGQIGDARSVESLIGALRDENEDVRGSAGEALVKVGAPSVEPLIAALRDEDEYVRRSAADALVRIGPPSVEPLIAALRDKDEYVRVRAADALVKIGAPSVEPLIAALQDENTDARSSAAEALGQIGDARAVEPLIAALRYEDEYVRRSAAEALGQIGDKRAVEPLIAALRDNNTDVRRDAADALGLIEDARAVEPLIAALRDAGTFLRGFDTDVRWRAADALAKFGAPSVEPLIAALRDKDEYVRRSAADALVKIGAPSIEPLVAALRDEDRNVRMSAAYALVKIGAPSVEPLIAALRVKDDYVRRSAADALVEIGAPSVEPLIAALRDENEDVRRSATYALRQIGDARAVEPLIAALRDEDTDVRGRAAYALGEIGAPSVEPLIAALRDDDRSVRMSAAYALGKIRDARAVEPLFAGLRDEDGNVRWHAADALGQMGDARAVEPLIAALRDKNTDVRRRSAYTLGQIGDARAIEPFIAALRDEDRDVRRRAADALEKIGDARAVEPLIAALQDENTLVRRRAADALVRIGDARAVEPLIAALQDENTLVRSSAAEALGQIGHARAVEPLFAALRDEDGNVRWHAADALVKIGAPSVEPLIAALRHKDSDVRFSAVHALGRIGDARALNELDRIARVNESERPGLITVAHVAGKAAESIRQRQHRETEKRE